MLLSSGFWRAPITWRSYDLLQERRRSSESLSCTCHVSNSFGLKHFLCQMAYFGVACPDPLQKNFTHFKASILGKTHTHTHMCTYVYIEIGSQASLFTDFIFVNLPTCRNLFLTLKSVVVALSWSWEDMPNIHISSCWTRLWICPLVSALTTVNKHPFCCHSATFLFVCIFALFAGDFSKMATKHSVEVLSGGLSWVGVRLWCGLQRKYM